MNKTKIDWCDSTLNPVMGCPNGCEYCYGRKLNCRWHFVADWSKPVFFPERLKALKCKKPKSIFMDSMSDCGHWSVNQIRKIANAMSANSQHNYIFLTKRPDLFIKKCKAIVEDANKGNVWVGTTITTRDDMERLNYLPIFAHKFVSIEPILADLGKLVGDDENSLWGNSLLFDIPYAPEVIIIGAETGNRKDKVIPPKEWVENIVKGAERFNKILQNNSVMRKNGWQSIKIFMKESLREIMGEQFRQDKLPWEV